VRAFVLVNTITGLEEEVLKQLKKLRFVKEVHRVYGVYDTVVTVEFEKAEDLEDVVFGGIRHMKGVQFTLTIPTVKGFNKKS
jgi:DNA-binding Lrp family transcriptional regulator